MGKNLKLVDAALVPYHEARNSALQTLAIENPAKPGEYGFPPTPEGRAAATAFREAERNLLKEEHKLDLARIPWSTLEKYHEEVIADENAESGVTARVVAQLFDLIDDFPA